MNKKGKCRIKRIVVTIMLLIVTGILLLMINQKSWQNHLWKEEYENGVTVMEYQLSIYMDDPYMQDEYDQHVQSRRKETLEGFLEELDGLVRIYINNFGKDTGSEEEIYRQAACILANNYEWRYMGKYEYFIHYEEDVEGKWKEFCSMIEESGRPIDEKMELLWESAESYPTVDVEIYWLMSEAWEEEFYHCVDTIRTDVEESDIEDKEKVLQALERYESFVGKWAKYNDTFAAMDTPTASGRFVVAEGRAQAFRTGTGILLELYRNAGREYEFIYDYEKDRQYVEGRIGNM